MVLTSAHKSCSQLRLSGCCHRPSCSSGCTHTRSTLQARTHAQTHTLTGEYQYTRTEIDFSPSGGPLPQSQTRWAGASTMRCTHPCYRHYSDTYYDNNTCHAQIQAQRKDARLISLGLDTMMQCELCRGHWHLAASVALGMSLQVRPHSTPANPACQCRECRRPALQWHSGLPAATALSPPESVEPRQRAHGTLAAYGRATADSDTGAPQAQARTGGSARRLLDSGL